MKIKTPALSQAISDEMAKRKKKMRQLETSRYNEVCLRIPGFAELDADYKAMTFDIGRSIIKGTTQNAIFENAELLLSDYESKRKDLLIKNGFPSNYLEHQFVCRECMDTGKVKSELCRCVNQLAISVQFQDSGLSSTQSFENFNLDLQKSEADRNAMSKICDAALNYAKLFPNNERHDILYIGEPGVGKTYLLNCIGGEILKRGYSVLKVSSNRLIQLTLDTLRADLSEKPDFVFPDLLIIDDLGTEPMIPNITVETLLGILCQRQDLAKATLFATNLDALPSGNETNETIWSLYGERFASRIIAPRTVKTQKIRTTNIRLSSHS